MMAVPVTVMAPMVVNALVIPVSVGIMGVQVSCVLVGGHDLSSRCVATASRE